MRIIRKLGEALFLLTVFSLLLILSSWTGAGDDQFEENDDLEHAFELEPGVYPDLSASDPDFYRVICDSKGILRITIWYEASLGDLTLSLFDETGTLLVHSDSHSGEERVEVSVSYGENYAFEVGNGSGIDYHMAVVNGDDQSWIFSVYMDGDNTLHDNMEPDLVEMRTQGSGGGLHLPVLKDGKGSKDSVVVYVMQGYDLILPVYVVNQSWGKEVNMGDPGTLENWLRWSNETFATGGKIALDLWDHGNGVWGACWDSTSGDDILTLKDIRLGLERSGVGRIELLGSDSCLMQVLELSHEVKGLANYFIASQDDEPKDGWDYEPFLEELAGNLGWTGEQLGRSIISGYMEEYGEDGDETLSLIDLGNVEALENSLSELVGELIDNIDIWADEIRSARDDTRDFNYYYADLLDFTRKLGTRTQNNTVIGLVEAVVSNAGKAILHEEHGGKRYDSNGLSIYFPKSGYDSDYDEISFGVESGWGEFLKEWIPTPGGPTDYFDRLFFYPLDNDSFPGDDTLQVKFKPFTDKSDEKSVILIELINESGFPVVSKSMDITLHLTHAEYTDSYLHLGNGDHIGEYYVRISLFDSQGNQDDVRVSDPFSLHVLYTEPPIPDPPNFEINHDRGFPLVVNQGDSLLFTIDVKSGEPSSFEWDFDGDNITDLKTDSVEYQHRFIVPGNYEISVIGRDDWNQTNVNSISVFVNSHPILLVNESQQANPGMVEISLTTSDPDGDIILYEWDENDDDFFEGVSDVGFPRYYQMIHPGEFMLTFRVTDSNGATDKGTITIHINYNPSVHSLNFSETVENHESVILFLAEADDPDGHIVKYEWDLDGDGIFERETNSNATSGNLPPGNTSVTVRVWDNMGLSGVFAIPVLIRQIPEIILWNGDGIPIITDNLTHPSGEPLMFEISIIGFLNEKTENGLLIVRLDDFELLSESISFEGPINVNSTFEVTGKPGSHKLIITLTSNMITVTRTLMIHVEEVKDRESSGDLSDPVDYTVWVSFIVLACAAISLIYVASRKNT